MFQSVDDTSPRLRMREEVLNRSLRDHTTCRLTHYSPFNATEYKSPLLTSRVIWGNESREPGPSWSPATSAGDQLPSEVLSLELSCTSSSKMTQSPSFPGNRDIIPIYGIPDHDISLGSWISHHATIQSNSPVQAPDMPSSSCAYPQTHSHHSEWTAHMTCNQDYVDEVDSTDTSATSSPALTSLPSLPLTEMFNSESSVVELPDIASSPQATRDKSAWKKYAVLIKGTGRTREFRCVWRTENETHECGYIGKRNLVKRHVETTHLKYKDHVCKYCGKAFPQRISLNIHINRHTGEKPHVCPFLCGMKFGDPARRHRHMVVVHGYEPQGARKKHRAGDSHSTHSRFETVPPWDAHNI